MNQENEWIVSVPQEFSFQANLNYMKRSTNESMFEVESDRVRMVIPISNEHYLIEISEYYDGNLFVQLLGDIHHSLNGEDVSLYIRELFDLDRDLKPFYKLAEKDRLLQDAIIEHYGLRVVGVPNLFEAIVWAILGQQINLAFAYTLKKRFVETFGESIIFEGRHYWIFPRANDIAKLQVTDLTPLKLSIKKSEYIIGVARLLTEKKLTKEMLSEAADLKTAEKILTNIRGIGPWTANYVLMRSVRFTDAFPIADVGLLNAIRNILGTKEKPTSEELMELAKRWSGWEAYATFYLWRTLY
ncbi:DNA-3-methyladenine glycosylase family protein [Oceanobacillus sp. CAU 1775]